MDVKQIRDRTRLHQKEFAKIAGISPRTIVTLENLPQDNNEEDVQRHIQFVHKYAEKMKENVFPHVWCDDVKNFLQEVNAEIPSELLWLWVVDHSTGTARCFEDFSHKITNGKTKEKTTNGKTKEKTTKDSKREAIPLSPLLQKSLISYSYFNPDDILNLAGDAIKNHPWKNYAGRKNKESAHPQQQIESLLHIVAPSRSQPKYLILVLNNRLKDGKVIIADDSCKPIYSQRDVLSAQAKLDLFYEIHVTDLPLFGFNPSMSKGGKPEESPLWTI